MAEVHKSEDIEAVRKAEFQEKLRSLALMPNKQAKKITTNVSDNCTVHVIERDETQSVTVNPNRLEYKLGMEAK